MLRFQGSLKGPNSVRYHRVRATLEASLPPGPNCGHRDSAAAETAAVPPPQTKAAESPAWRMRFVPVGGSGRLRPLVSGFPPLDPSWGVLSGQCNAYPGYWLLRIAAEGQPTWRVVGWPLRRGWRVLRRRRETACPDGCRVPWRQVCISPDFDRKVWKSSLGHNWSSARFG